MLCGAFSVCYSGPRHAGPFFPSGGYRSAIDIGLALVRAAIPAQSIQFKGDREYTEQELLDAAGPPGCLSKINASAPRGICAEGSVLTAAGSA